MTSDSLKCHCFWGFWGSNPTLMSRIHAVLVNARLLFQPMPFANGMLVALSGFRINLQLGFEMPANEN